MTYYEILGVPRDATPSAIKKAFRQQAGKFHPDVVGEHDLEAMCSWNELREAYGVLSDPVQRRRYDLGNEPIDSLFALFNRAEGVRLMQAMLPGAPLAERSGVTMASVVEAPESSLEKGGVLDVPLLGRIGAITVPPGAKQLRYGRLSGLGEPGQNDGPAGDHLVILVPRG